MVTSHTTDGNQARNISLPLCLLLHLSSILCKIFSSLSTDILFCRQNQIKRWILLTKFPLGDSPSQSYRYKTSWSSVEQWWLLRGASWCESPEGHGTSYKNLSVSVHMTWPARRYRLLLMFTSEPTQKKGHCWCPLSQHRCRETISKGQHFLTCVYQHTTEAQLYR